MQRPTCQRLRVRSPLDAQTIFHAVSQGILPMVARRLDTEERRAIHSGCVFVWEERSVGSDSTSLGIERWTDGIRWGPSRVRDEFLFYHEKDQDPADMDNNSDSDGPFGTHRGMLPPEYSRNVAPADYGTNKGVLVKQTYSVFVETPRGRRKWHLIAYFTQDSVDYLRSVEDIPELASLTVPPGMYKSARSAKGRPRDERYFDRQYAPYLYGGPHEHVSFPPKSSWVDINALQEYQPRHLGPQNTTQVLAPLAYLQNIAQPRRHPLDEKALMSFHPGLA